MLSGNGRHRRPRQAPALLVAAGVTGSAIAIPLLGASGASAADGTTWDRVADCETGGAWSENSGNGYFGGLALSQENWETYGGTDYAPSADLASRSQQIAVAERILADQGVGAWRTCGLLSGLEQGKGSGTSESPESSDSANSLDLLNSSEGSSSSDAPSDSSSPSSSGTSTPERGESSESGKSPESGESASRDQRSGSAPAARPEGDGSGDSRGDASPAPEDAGSGRHRGPSADENAESANGRTDESSGRHASRDVSRDAANGSYVVRPGDNLSAIADSLDLGGGWRALYAGNKDAVGGDPNLIRPGQKLTVEGEADEE